jgi:hypothetical protein
VPQIWLDYAELAALIGCDVDRAREAAAALTLDRRRSRDGQTRTKLTPQLMEAFLDRLVRARLERELALCAGDLRAMRERMGASARTPKLPSVVAV